MPQKNRPVVSIETVRACDLDDRDIIRLGKYWVEVLDVFTRSDQADSEGLWNPDSRYKLSFGTELYRTNDMSGEDIIGYLASSEINVLVRFIEWSECINGHVEDHVVVLPWNQLVEVQVVKDLLKINPA